MWWERAYVIGRKVGISKVDAQSCLYDMLKSNILATFWHIAFENPFNGDRGLSKIKSGFHTKKFANTPFQHHCFFLGKIPNATITQPILLPQKRNTEILVLPFWVSALLSASLDVFVVMLWLVEERTFLLQKVVITLKK